MPQGHSIRSGIRSGQCTFILSLGRLLRLLSCISFLLWLARLDICVLPQSLCWLSALLRLVLLLSSELWHFGLVSVLQPPAELSFSASASRPAAASRACLSTCSCCSAIFALERPAVQFSAVPPLKTSSPQSEWLAARLAVDWCGFHQAKEELVIFPGLGELIGVGEVGHGISRRAPRLH